MSVMYCEYCHEMVDTDWNCEHFDEEGDCEIEKDENNLIIRI